MKKPKFFQAKQKANYQLRKSVYIKSFVYNYLVNRLFTCTDGPLRACLTA